MTWVVGGGGGGDSYWHVHPRWRHYIIQSRSTIYTFLGVEVANVYVGKKISFGDA